ncbi:MAG: choice-of-anchor Q domain-containing protein, partial [Blastocatellia bacterium]
MGRQREARGQGWRVKAVCGLVLWGLVGLVRRGGFDLFPTGEAREHGAGKAAVYWAAHQVDRVTDEPDLIPGDGLCQAAGGGCTLRAALQEAIALGVAAQTIEIVATGTIELTAPLPIINNINGLTSLVLAGPGADRLTIRRQSGGSYRIFESVPTLLAVLDLEIRGMTIADGSSTAGGAVYNLLSNLILRDCHLTGNTAADGAAIYVGLANATLVGCTFSGNTNTSPSGAAVAFDTLGVATTLTIENSTISGNSRHGVRVGLAVAGSSATIRSATIAGNGGQGVVLGGNGGMVVSLASTILAENTGGSLAVTGTNTIVSAGYNLADDGGGGYLTATGDQTMTDPRLAVLGMYGGPTPTRALLPGSPALDVGGTVAAQDQRGRARVGASDAGAFESAGFSLAVAGGAGQVAPLGSTFAQPLTVVVTPLSAGEPVNGGRVLFVAPDPGAGGVATIAGPTSIEGPIGGGIGSTGPIVAGTVEGGYQVVAGTRGAIGTALFPLRNNTPPSVLSVIDVGLDPAVTASLRFQVTFSEGMTGGSPSNFSLVPSGLVGSSISSVSGTGATRMVTVLAGSGIGTLRLDLVNSTGLADLDGAGVIGLPVVGPTVTPIIVQAIERLDANPTSSAEVAFRVTFLRGVSGLSPGNFALAVAGLTGASIETVTGGGAVWTVRVARGTGVGTIGLTMVNDGGVTADGPITNLPFTGQAYTIVLPPLVVQAIERLDANPTSSAEVAFR